MNRTLLVGTLLTLAVIGGAVKKEPITILKARVMPLHVPDNNRDRPFTREDVHLLGGIDAQPVETREIALQCGNYAMRINPMTGVAYSGPPKEPRRSRGSVDAHIIVIQNPSNGYTVRIDHDAMTYSVWSAKNEPKESGTCTLMP